MKPLATFIMRGWPQAVTVTSFTALAVTMVPLLFPLLWISAASVALVTLRLGAMRGGQVLLAASALLALLLVVALSQHALSVLTWSFIWAVALIAAEVLRRSVRLAAAVEAIGVALGVALIAFHLAVGDTAAWWSAQFELLFDVLHAGAAGESGASLTDLREMFLASAGFMTQAMAISLLASQVIALLLARHWQAMLYNPGGLRREFHALRFDMRWSLLVVALVIAAMLVKSQLLADLASLSVLVYALQGLAVLHALGAAKGLPGFWLVLIYAPLAVVFTAAVQLLALLGLIDTWLDLRKRMGAGAGG